MNLLIIEEELKMKTNTGKKKKFDILLFIAILLLIAGVALLLVDPIKNHIRKNAVQKSVEEIKLQIDSTEESAVYTIVVPVNGNEVEGEDYDYFVEDDEELERQRAEIEAELEALGDQVTLTAIGILEIDKIELQVPIWDEASVISLRYGVGHYEYSVLPGEEGNCSILGHHMRAYGSMFNRLSEVEVGDILRIRSVDGHIYNYEVDTVTIIPPSELDKHINYDFYDDARLTLVTCAYTSRGTERLLVVGHLVE